MQARYGGALDRFRNEMSAGLRQQLIATLGMVAFAVAILVALIVQMHSSPPIVIHTTLPSEASAFTSN